MFQAVAVIDAVASKRDNDPFRVRALENGGVGADPLHLTGLVPDLQCVVSGARFQIAGIGHPSPELGVVLLGAQMPQGRGGRCRRQERAGIEPFEHFGHFPGAGNGIFARIVRFPGLVPEGRDRESPGAQQVVDPVDAERPRDHAGGGVVAQRDHETAEIEEGEFASNGQIADDPGALLAIRFLHGAQLVLVQSLLVDLVVESQHDRNLDDAGGRNLGFRVECDVLPGRQVFREERLPAGESAPGIVEGVRQGGPGTIDWDHGVFSRRLSRATCCANGEHGKAPAPRRTAVVSPICHSRCGAGKSDKSTLNSGE